MVDFSNKYTGTVDDKGRVVIPSAFKKEVGESYDGYFIVEKDPFEKCLNIYLPEQWEMRTESIRNRLNINDPVQSRFLDKFYQTFVKLPMSDKGRLNIPNLMLNEKGIKKDVVFTGQGIRIRLWDVEEYEKSLMPEDEFSETFKKLLGGDSTSQY
ncbi:MAG: hypothetical protein Q8862_02620 [Bacteroidota bacterium]|nr:hypothetical protein [Bacteroidota bacterium]MDP4204694.1 hypothetical protein [Bacteroidota bacterium]